MSTFNVKLNILFQDNTSNICLPKKVNESYSKRTRHLDTRSLYAKYLINTKEATVHCCPIDMIWEDCDAKPLVGIKFKLFRDIKMSISDLFHLIKKEKGVNKVTTEMIQGDPKPEPHK